ncbi:MAG: hypothetical protein ABIJ57_09225 [Pseudomonadota bacterium]|uniref:Uncharacterized protein n=1 Tax=viral metagenome TaxID=1070528 RepID=A0A6M3JTH7_9ZZZZ
MPGGFDIEKEVAIMAEKLEGYHKEKNNCRETCTSFGKRIGNLESMAEVHEYGISIIRENMKEIMADIKKMRWQTALIVGGIVVLSQIVNFKEFFVR